MNPFLIAVIGAGACVGVGVALIISALLPEHPRLSDALAALDERVIKPEGSPTSPTTRMLLPLLGGLPGTVPDADLDLLGISRDRFLLCRALEALKLGALGPVLGAVLALLDAGLGLAVPAVTSLIGVAVGWTTYGRQVSDRAEHARTEMRFALVSYLQQVSLLRSGGAGVATALTVPARLLSDSWAMRRLRDELELAERSGHMPWEGIRRFGERIQLSELADLSSIAATAGQDGGAVISTLLARAESLRDELLADEQADANRASGLMSTPGAVQVALIAVWVIYPAGVALLSST